MVVLRVKLLPYSSGALRSSLSLCYCLGKVSLYSYEFPPMSTSVQVGELDNAKLSIDVNDVLSWTGVSG